MSAVEPPRNVTNSDLLQWVFVRLNAHDLESLRQCWTDATVEYFPDAVCRGADEIADYVADRFAAIEGFNMEVISIAEAGDDAFVHWRMTGQHTGRLVGIAGTGRALEIDGMDHFVLRDGKVVTGSVVFDQMNFARQVGMLPPDGSVADRAVKHAFNAKTRIAAAFKRRR